MDLGGSLFSYSNNYNFVTDAFLIDDLSEFSNEDIGGSIPGSSNSASFFSDEYSSLNAILDSDGFSSILGANFDIHQFSSAKDEQIGLEWLTDFANSGSDCSTEAVAPPTTSEWEGEKQRKTATEPQEELMKQRASSSLNMVIPCRARTKRKRCQVWPKPGSTPSALALEEEENEGGDEDDEYDGKENKGKEGKGKGKRRESQPRRCTHCQTHKTPQWRQGPLGPKSLCNACGVRYKAGGLFPEYRPEKSPTFVSYVHSNSSKKVREMRGACLPNLPKPQIDEDTTEQRQDRVDIEDCHRLLYRLT